jgi:hypothetical protein
LIIHDLLLTSKRLLLDFLQDENVTLLAVLGPDLFLIGSIAEDTRFGHAIEIDLNNKLTKLKPTFFKVHMWALKVTGEGKEFFSKLFPDFKVKHI